MIISALIKAEILLIKGGILKPKIAINGLGRVGRAIAKLALEDDTLDLVAVNDLASKTELLYLLKYDSSHRKKDFTLKDNHFFYKNKSFKVYNDSDFKNFAPKADILIDATGVAKSIDDYKNNKSKKIALTYIAKGVEIAAFKLNENAFKNKVFSFGSCTSLPFAFVADIFAKHFNAKKSFVSSVHSYNFNQSLLDRQSTDPMAVRSSTTNIILANTNAANNASCILQDLNAKGQAIRVPLKGVCLLDITFVLGTLSTKEQINKTIKSAIDKDYFKILAYTEKELVSSDFAQSPYAGIVDLSLTIVLNDLVKIAIWHDNEYGFASYLLTTLKGV